MRDLKNSEYKTRSRSKSPLGKESSERNRDRSRRRDHHSHHQETRNDRDHYRERSLGSHKDEIPRGSLRGKEEDFKNRSVSSSSLSDRERAFREGRTEVDSQAEMEDKDKPNYATSGKLAKDTNLVNGVLSKYNEPEDSQLPSSNDNFQLFVFNGSSTEAEIKLNQRSHYLFGRDDKIAHILLQNPTCSKQHAVIQFRRIIKRTGPLGETSELLKAYIIDLDSSYGTKLNGEKIPSSRYIELKNKDLIQFARSKREYVFMQQRLTVR